METRLAAVEAAAGQLGLTLSADQLATLAAYRALVLLVNQQINLTGIREPDAFERLHLVDALSLLPAMGRRRGPVTRLVDIGSGAGLPGVPLAIVRPDLRVTLVEATAKKATFLQRVVDELGLANVAVVAGRAEDLAHRVELRECFDVATARAVAALPTLVELGLPFLRVGGRLLAPKKRAIEAELQAVGPALRLLGGQLGPPVPVELPELTEHQIIVVYKQRPTLALYPRRAGLPAHQPLGERS